MTVAISGKNMSTEKTHPKHKSLDKDNLMVNSEELVFLDSKKRLPFIKCIELIKYTPKHFDLDKWQPTFILPNSWMQKIYKHDVYRDTDDPLHQESEHFTPKQIKIINDYVQRQRRLSKGLDTYDPKNRRQQPPLDCLTQYLEMPAHSLRKSDKSRETKPVACREDDLCQPMTHLNSDNIAILYSHRIQPEDIIVKMALEKMRKLDDHQEEKYQKLLKDNDFMKRLSAMIEDYFKIDQANTLEDSSSTDCTEIL